MKFNIVPENAKFIENKEKRTVVCVIEHTGNLFKKFVEENFRINSDCDNEWTWRNTAYTHASILHDKLSMPNKFVGVATCSPDDEWNPEIGRIIAFTRAKDNLLISFFKRANTYINYIDKGVDDAVLILNELGEKLSRNRQHRHDYIKSLVGENPIENNGNTQD